MKRRRRLSGTKQWNRWAVGEWERAWHLAMMRIDGAPSVVVEQGLFQESLAVLDGASADGNSSRFQLGLMTLMDVCTEAVTRGACKQWWGSRER